MTAPSTKGKGKAYLWIVANVGHQGGDCLKWPFSTDHLGRGSFGYLGKHYKAPAFMCERAHGPKPTPEHEAGHSCGKGHEGCTNPRHLSWVTRSENGRDRRQHGTAVTTRHGWKGKLTKEQVAEIRRLKDAGAPALTLARQFNISTRTIDYWTNGLRERRGHTGKPLGYDGNSYRVRREKAARG